MRVFITGGSGHIGSTVVADLLENGHSVVALARSDTSAEIVAAAGAEVLRGTIDDPEVLRQAALDADGVIHLAYHHDFSDSAAAGVVDLAAVRALGAGLESSGKPLAEHAAMGLAEHGVRASVVRLAPARDCTASPTSGSRLRTSPTRSLSGLSCRRRRSRPRTPRRTSASSAPWWPWTTRLLLRRLTTSKTILLAILGVVASGFNTELHTGAAVRHRRPRDDQQPRRRDRYDQL